MPLTFKISVIASVQTRKIMFDRTVSWTSQEDIVLPHQPTGPLTHNNWRFQSSEDEIVWMIDVRVPSMDQISSRQTNSTTNAAVCTLVQRADRVSFSQCIVMTAAVKPPHRRWCPHSIDAFGGVGAEYGRRPLRITIPPLPGWPTPFQKHSHSVTDNK